jgi:hypothetical protein
VLYSPREIYHRRKQCLRYVHIFYAEEVRAIIVKSIIIFFCSVIMHCHLPGSGDYTMPCRREPIASWNGVCYLIRNLMTNSESKSLISSTCHKKCIIEKVICLFYLYIRLMIFISVISNLSRFDRNVRLSVSSVYCYLILIFEII